MPEKGRKGPRHAMNSDFCKPTTKKKLSLPALPSKKKCFLPSSRHPRTVCSTQARAALGTCLQRGLWRSCQADVYSDKAGHKRTRGF